MKITLWRAGSAAPFSELHVPDGLAAGRILPTLAMAEIWGADVVGREHDRPAPPLGRPVPRFRVLQAGERAR